ncbi:hypothetical protein FHG87_011752 [Trinorchestia longiramus]|nr:hypothetical protein FHG87_011752 [Trinorchestia longiramus]
MRQKVENLRNKSPDGIKDWYNFIQESLIDVVHEQCGESKWNARCVEEDSGMRYLVGLDEECNRGKSPDSCRECAVLIL